MKISPEENAFRDKRTGNSMYIVEKLDSFTKGNGKITLFCILGVVLIVVIILIVCCCKKCCCKKKKKGCWQKIWVRYNGWQVQKNKGNEKKSTFWKLLQRTSGSCEGGEAEGMEDGLGAAHREESL